MREKIVGVNLNWRIIDGEGLGDEARGEELDRGENISPAAIEARKSFTDQVMEKIGDSLPFDILDGGLKDGRIGVKNTEVTVVFMGPKRLPIIKAAWDSPKPQGHGFNILNFFRRDS